MLATRFKKYSVTCPNCEQPHHYAEIIFSAVNDPGFWVISCSECREPFYVSVRNPHESNSGDCQIVQVVEGDHYNGVSHRLRRLPFIILI